MAGFTYPSVLDSANWNKQKGVPPKSDVAKALDTLKRAHSGVDTSLLDTGKLKSAEEMQERVASIEAEQKKGVKSAADAADNAATAAADFKKAKDTSKEAAAAATAVAKAAADYASSLADAFESVLKELAPKLAKAEAEAKKKDEEADDDEGDPDLEKDKKKVGKLVEAAMKEAKKKPMKFMIGAFKKQVYVFVGKAISSSTEKRIKKNMEVKEHVDIMRGTVTFEDNKVWVFEGVNIRAGGFAVLIQKAIIEQTGKRYKVKTRRPTGETDEAPGDSDADTDDELEQATEGGGKDASKAAEVLARHKKLKPLFDGLLAGGSPLAAEVRTGLASFETNVRGKKFDEALKVLDNLEKTIRDKAKAAQAGKSAADAAAESKAKQTADAAIDKASKDSAKQGATPSTQLAEEWKTTAATARKGINDLADKIQADFASDPKVNDAVKRLRDLAKGLEVDLADKLSAALKQPDAGTKGAARAALGQVATVVANDLMKEIDGNELMTSLKVVEPMRKKLVEIGAALK